VAQCAIKTALVGKMRYGLRKIVIAIVYCVGVLLFFEVSARGILWSDMGFRRIVGSHIVIPHTDDTAWRLKFVRSHQSGESPPIRYPFDIYHPTRGWTLQPGLSRITVFNNNTLSSNSRGLRGSSEHAYEKPPGTLRILALGDSFTFGSEVSDNETWTYYLEKLVPGSEVINFGVQGYGHDQMLLYLQEEGVKYHPDIVILGFLAIDMERNVMSFRDSAKPRFILDGRRLVLTNTPVPRVEETLAREPWRSKFVDVLTMLRARYRERSGQIESEKERITVALLNEIASTIRAAGAVPLFVYLPCCDEINRRDMGDGERFFFSYCREHGVQSISLQRFFREKLERGIHLREGHFHWGPEEHRTAAEGIREYLAEHGIVRPSQPTAVDAETR
jgi:hypothetical protein